MQRNVIDERIFFFIVTFCLKSLLYVSLYRLCILIKLNRKKLINDKINSFNLKFKLIKESLNILSIINL